MLFSVSEAKGLGVVLVVMGHSVVSLCVVESEDHEGSRSHNVLLVGELLKLCLSEETYMQLYDARD